MMRRLALLICLFLIACSEEQAPLVATEVWVKAPMPGMRMSAGYLTLHNTTGSPITITGASSPQFEAVELHETVMEDDVARMVALHAVTIPANEALRFEPGGKHLMLMRPTGELDTVTLQFYSDADLLLTVTAPVTRQVQ